MIKTSNLVADCFSKILGDNGNGNGNGASTPFKLEDDFIAQFEGRKPNFGFNGLGEFVFSRTYTRVKPDGIKESCIEAFRRVVEGTYEIQRQHCSKQHIPWTRTKAQASAQEMFQRMWDFKFLPPGRGLWAMGTPFMWERGSAALNNCGFVSTKNIDKDPAEPFHFMIDMSMLGVGVGFDTRGAGKLAIRAPRPTTTLFNIPDSREGWADSVKMLLESYTIHPEYGYVKFNYDDIRPAGTPINGFGGKASGPGILVRLHDMLRELLEMIAVRADNTLSSVDIVDIMNMIGKCVVAGNVRRTAEIAFGEVDDIDYREMKNPLKGLLPEERVEFNQVTNALYLAEQYTARPSDFNGCGIDGVRLAEAIYKWNQLNSHRWASNNSVMSEVGMDYRPLAASTAENGEPGYLWLDNIRNYGRMIDGPQPGIDRRAMGSNPCVEQTLESNELCCLVETFPVHHDDAEDYKRTLKFAYLYGKTVTLLPTHNAKTNAVMQRNRRIGLSQSGIIQAFKKFGYRQVLSNFCDQGYKEISRWDDIYSEWLCVGRSIKKTSVKPSGTVSLVAGTTAGIHYTIAPTRAYWRNVRVSNDDPLLGVLRQAGYHIEPDVKDNRTSVVRFGVHVPDVETVGEISIWEQVKNAADYQRYWADNQVSCTVQFKPEEGPVIAKVLSAFEDHLKGISFLPLENHGYPQAPYQAATPEEVEAYLARLGPLDFSHCLSEDAEATKFCDGDKCTV